MDYSTALRLHLRHAVEAWGGDLPVAPAAMLRPAAPPEIAVTTAVAPTPAVTAAVAIEPAPATPLRIEPPPDLNALRETALACNSCKLRAGCKQVVFGEGSPAAEVMFVGEAPGAREDDLGRPFVGPAGQLLTKIIENAMGLQRADVYIANVNKCRPPGNRNPEPDEIAACLPLLQGQIRAIRPKALVLLGRVAAQNLLGTTASMGSLRGRDLEYEGTPVVATWHPAYLLRQPAAKRETWEDIKRVNRMLGRPEVPSGS